MIRPFQRDEPESVEALRVQVQRDTAAVRAMSARGDARRRARLLGRLGTGCRVLGRGEEAVRWLGEAVELSRALGDAELEIANLIRLATAFQYAGRYDEARAMLEKVVGRCASGEAPDYEDFALQHLGKVFAEQGRARDAIPLFERALTLRRRKGDPQLVASTERALAGVRLLLRGPNHAPDRSYGRRNVPSKK